MTLYVYAWGYVRVCERKKGRDLSLKGSIYKIT